MSTQNIESITSYLREFAPLALSEDWDNTGLLVGDATAEVRKVLTCLTLTPDVASEAVEQNVDLIVTHHPILFRAVQRLTTQTTEGAMLLKLIESKVAVYSPHTSYDSATEGINRQLADLLHLQNVQPIRPLEESADGTGTDPVLGSGRWGILPAATSLELLAEQVKSVLGISAIQYVGDRARSVLTIGIACGAAAEFLGDAAKLGCDVLLTGEARFHDCLAARARNIALLLPGHYATERHGMEFLANRLQNEFPDLEVTASVVESDPVEWL